MVLFAAIGTAVLLTVHAATTPAIIVSPQSGAVSGNALIVSNSSAIGGKTVKFGATTTKTSSGSSSKPTSTGGTTTSTGGTGTTTGGGGTTVTGNECTQEGGNNSSGGCYFWGQGIQTGLTATGAQVTMSAVAPAVSSQDYHSDSEMYVATSNESDSVEVSTIVGPGSSTPHLLIDYWKNGGIYDDSFVAVAGAPIANGGNMPTTGTFTITVKYVNTQWQVDYNGAEVGYYPDTVWGANVFTQAQFVDIYGEVEGTATLQTTSQMGNGQLGTSPNSAYFSNYSLIGSTATPDLTVAGPSGAAANVYKVGYITPTGFHYGGPGF